MFVVQASELQRLVRDHFDSFVRCADSIEKYASHINMELTNNKEQARVVSFGLGRRPYAMVALHFLHMCFLYQHKGVAFRYFINEMTSRTCAPQPIVQGSWLPHRVRDMAWDNYFVSPSSADLSGAEQLPGHGTQPRAKKMKDFRF